MKTEKLAVLVGGAVLLLGIVRITGCAESRFAHIPIPAAPVDPVEADAAFMTASGAVRAGTRRPIGKDAELVTWAAWGDNDKDGIWNGSQVIVSIEEPNPAAHTFRVEVYDNDRQLLTCQYIKEPAAATLTIDLQKMDSKDWIHVEFVAVTEFK